MAVADPSAGIMIEPLCPPERHGHASFRVSVNPRCVGRPYRYAYGHCIVGPRPCAFFNGVCRVDVTDGTVLTWSDEPSAVAAGPPIFVPRPDASEGDETAGVLLVDCLGAGGTSFFSVLDGVTLVELARVAVPFRQCPSLRNTWVWERPPEGGQADGPVPSDAEPLPAVRSATRGAMGVAPRVQRAWRPPGWRAGPASSGAAAANAATNSANAAIASAAAAATAAAHSAAAANAAAAAPRPRRHAPPQLTFEQIRSTFALTQLQAADALGVGTTYLKVGVRA